MRRFVFPRTSRTFGEIQSHSKSINELVLAKNRVMDAHRKFGECNRSKAKNVRISCVYETRVVDSPKFITIYERKIANF